ncbi:unnamed protein product, partial [Cyprideis torosa]
MNQPMGRFVSFEGSEGVGKTTQIARLKRRLESLGRTVVTTREPGGTEVAEQIRNLVLDKTMPPMAPDTELLLIYAARAEHVARVIKPALDDGAVVISDRFADASMAYQGFARGIDVGRLKELNQWVLGGFKPDVTVLLDMPVQVGMERARARDTLDRFEQEEIGFFERVRQGYLSLAREDPDRVKIVDANGSVDEVASAIASVVEGVPGLGKEMFGRAFSQSLYCQNLQDNEEACGSCASCHQFEAGTLSDFRLLTLEEGHASIGVEQIRETIEFLTLSHEHGRKKVAMLWPADRMNINAANSLLKTLEEPAGDSLIILVASQPERLPVTIRSRCQVVSIPAPSRTNALAWLSTQGYENADLALAVAGGAPLAAVHFSEDALLASFDAVLGSLVAQVTGQRSMQEVISVWRQVDVESLLDWMVLISEWSILCANGIEQPSIK